MAKDKQKKQKKFDYFTAFENQIKLACKEAELLTETIKGFKDLNNPEDLQKIMVRAHDIEHEADEICHDVFTAIATDFITPIEREDIVSLTQFFDDILDYIEDVVQRFFMYDILEMHEDALEFAEIIEKSCNALNNAMDDFRNFKKSKNFRQRIIDINSFEEDADADYMKIIRHLHVEHKDDPLYVLTWTQLFMRMEKCTDACEHAADTMRLVMLKNS